MHRSPPHSILQSPHNDLSKMVQRLCRIPCILTDSDGMCVDHSSGGMCVDHSSRQCFCFVLCRFRWYVLPQRHHFALCFSDGMCDVHRARQCFERPAAALGFVDIFNNTGSTCFSCFLSIVDNVDARSYTRTRTHAHKCFPVCVRKVLRAQTCTQFSVDALSLLSVRT